MNRHGTDLLSLVFGLVFAAFFSWWLLLQLATLAAPRGGWFVAATLLVIGAVGLVTTIGSWRGRHGDS